MPEVGALLASKYRVLALVGTGGMGSVFRAENVLTGKQVAVKWMHPQLAASPGATERLLREARAASKLSHPNVVDVYDVVTDGDTLLLVMELLHGQSLRDFLKNAAKPPLHELIAIMLGAMAGVRAAHEQGVIHRDLKPDNIFLEQVPGSRQPLPKVLDFGIAKLSETQQGSTLTQTGAAIGTPVYMSFEQLRGDKDVDVRTDVYAFGVMLYEALSGQPPYAAASLSELAIKVATTDAAPIKTLRPDVPTALCAIVDRAIRRRRDERWPDIASLMEQLAPFASERGLREQMTFQDMTAPRVATAKPPALPARSATPWGPTAHAAHTAAMPDTLRHTLDAPPVLSIAPPKQQLPASDSLMAHELAGASRQSASQQSVWLAAAAALAVTGIAAFFLLTPTTPPAPSPQSAVKQAPEHLAVPAPAPSPAPTLQFVPAQPEPTAPSPDSPPPAAPSGSADVAPSAFTPAAPAAQSRTPKRKSSARNEPTRRAEAQRPQLGKTPATESAPSTKPEPRAKSADDMLGF